MKQKHKYQVRLYYQTYCDVEVTATDEQDAQEQAYEQIVFGNHAHNQLIDNLEPFMDNDIKLIDDDYKK